jgi:hypothetical protein
MGKLRDAMTEVIQSRGLRNMNSLGTTGGFASSNPPVNTRPYVPRGGQNQGVAFPMVVVRFEFFFICLYEP